MGALIIPGMSEAADGLSARMQHLEAILQDAEVNLEPPALAALHELASGLLELHREALARLLQHMTAAGPAGQSILDACCSEELISPVLSLHDLHPRSLEQRVSEALDKARPYLASHGGHVELLNVSEDGTVHLRLEGSCHGCPSSRVTLRSSIEQEILRAAPEITEILVEGLAEEPPAAKRGFVPVESLAINGAAVGASRGLKIET